MFWNWIQLTRDAAMLAVETQRVMGLRMMKLSAGGPAAHAETLRMISEKGTAITEATLTLAWRFSELSHSALSKPCESK